MATNKNKQERLAALSAKQQEDAQLMARIADCLDEIPSNWVVTAQAIKEDLNITCPSHLIGVVLRAKGYVPTMANVWSKVNNRKDGE